MKKTDRRKVAKILTSILGMLLLCFFYSNAFGADTTKLGLLLPFSGPQAYSGDMCLRGVTIATNMINEKGGVFGKKVEWVKGNVIDPKTGMSETERLINDGVKVLLGTWGSSNAFAATQVAEKNRVIYWDTGTVADSIVERGFDYLFRVCAPASGFGIMAANFTSEVVAQKVGVNPSKVKVSIIHEDTLYGTTVGTYAQKRAKELGLNVLSVDSYSMSTTDLSPLVMKIKSAAPDVLIAVSYVNDGLLFYRQMKALNLNVKAFIGGGGCHSLPVWSETFKKEGDGVFTTDYGATGINTKALKPKALEQLQEFEKRYQKAYPGETPKLHSALFFLGTYALLDQVLPKAGSLDPEAIRKVCVNLDIPQGETIFGWGIKFAAKGDPKQGQNQKCNAFVMQWQNGDLKVVYPNEFAIANPILPFPTWSERGKSK
jgi:branched-chain amino acid transport system substrate-binding protein